MQKPEVVQLKNYQSLKTSVRHTLLFLTVVLIFGVSSSCIEEKNSITPKDENEILSKEITDIDEPEEENQEGDSSNDDGSAGEDQSQEQGTGRSYLALGDSYTIGQGVATNERWPTQLVERLEAFEVNFNAPRYIAQTGWTTGNLKSAISNQQPDNNFDLVSLLIGVNNQYRGFYIGDFEKEFEELLVTAIDLARGDKDRVFVVSIPDYGVTPFGGYSEQISKEIDEYNAIKETICEKYGVAYFYITDISRKAESDLSYLASDKLHPSGKMYREWVEDFVSDVVDMLKE